MIMILYARQQKHERSRATGAQAPLVVMTGALYFGESYKNLRGCKKGVPSSYVCESTGKEGL
jgi:hypothetical protein